VTFAELKTEIQRWLNRADFDTQAGLLINRVIRRTERKYNMAFMEAVTEATLAAGGYTFSVPARYKETLSLRVQDADRWKGLNKRDLGYVEGQFPDFSVDTGRPVLFATDNANSVFVLRPTADAAYDYKHRFYQFSALLVEDNATNWLTINAEDLLIYGSLLLFEPYRVNDERMGTWTSLYRDAIKVIEEMTLQEQTAGGPLQTASAYADIEGPRRY
jgi:hypothetical protein